MSLVGMALGALQDAARELLDAEAAELAARPKLGLGERDAYLAAAERASKARKALAAQLPPPLSSADFPLLLATSIATSINKQLRKAYDEAAESRRAPLTARQREVLDVIRAGIADTGYPPTLRAIGAALGIKSTNGVSDHLKALERKGHLVRHGASRASLSATVRALGEACPHCNGTGRAPLA